MKNIHQSLPGSLENRYDEEESPFNITSSLPSPYRSSSPTSFYRRTSKISLSTVNSSATSSLNRSDSLIHFTHSLSIVHKTSTDVGNSNDDTNQDDRTSVGEFGGPENFNLTEDLIVLIPFNHQVGGHTQLMLLNQDTLCKPLIPRELVFYLNIPCQLNGFVPEYKGVVEICHNESTIPTLYHPVKNISSSTSASNYHGNKPELRVRLSSCNDRGILESNHDPNDKQRGYSSRPNQQYFMLLENIASNYHLPCVLDLKMGTRQHSDDASDEKRRRQMAKCAASTSATFGVRICGMQVYQKVANNTYKIYQRDKYHGRRIKNENGLKDELKIYFQNRIYLIRPIITRLKQLKAKVIETLRMTSLRFFSTSLLIVSEGCFDLHQTRLKSKHQTFSDGEDYDCEDDYDCFDSEEDDELFRVNNQVQDQSKSNHQAIADDNDSTSSSLDSMSDESCLEKNSSDYSSEIPFDHYNCNHDHQRHRLPSMTNNVAEFDIRLIDFAHTSFNSSSSSDHGFLLGLDNLIRLLNEILFDEIQTQVMSQRNNKRRRSSSIQNIDNYNHFDHILHMPSNKKCGTREVDISCDEETLMETPVTSY